MGALANYKRLRIAGLQARSRELARDVHAIWAKIAEVLISL